MTNQSRKALVFNLHSTPTQAESKVNGFQSHVKVSQLNLPRYSTYNSIIRRGRRAGPMMEPTPSSAPASGSAPPSQQARSILSSVQNLATQEGLSPTSTVHPFSESPEETLTSLRGIVNATNQISHSLNTHLSLTMSDSKVLSLFRQYTTIINNVHVVRFIPFSIVF